MGRLSARSNPTNLTEIDRKRVTISISEMDGKRYFTLSQLDLGDQDLADNLKVFCVARAGKTSRRFDMGTAKAWKKESLPLDGLDRSETLRFRLFLREDGKPRLVASAENLRLKDESQSESLLPMEPADLGQLLWKLDFTDDGPVLKFNRTVFPSAVGVENYLPFGALVLPEAFRRVMEEIAEDPSRLDDEGDSLSQWGGWLDRIGAGRPPEDAADDSASRENWCSEAVSIFCERHRFAGRLQQKLISEGAHD